MAARARTIVVAYDGTKPSERALDAAANLVGYGSTLTVLGVRRNGAGHGLEAAREHLLRRQVPARYLASNDGLVETARDLAADLLVIGRPAAGDAKAAELDSVVFRAPCDLLVVT